MRRAQTILIVLTLAALAVIPLLQASHVSACTCGRACCVRHDARSANTPTRGKHKTVYCERTEAQDSCGCGMMAREGDSGFVNGTPPPDYLPGHTTVDLTVGKDFRQRFSLSVTALNVANRHLLIDNSLSFGGFHYDDPREIYVELHYHFRY